MHLGLCRLPSEEMNWWGGTICPPHESIEFGIALTEFLEVSGRILAVGEGFDGIDDAEVIEFCFIVPKCSYLLACKQLYLLWHIVYYFI